MNRRFRRALDRVKGKATPVDLNSIKQQFINKCFRAGQLQYEIVQQQKALDKLNKEIEVLNLEAAPSLTEQTAAAPSSKGAGEPSAPASPSKESA